MAESTPNLVNKEKQINNLKLEYEKDIYECYKEKMSYLLQFNNSGIDIVSIPKDRYTNEISNKINDLFYSCQRYAIEKLENKKKILE